MYQQVLVTAPDLIMDIITAILAMDITDPIIGRRSSFSHKLYGPDITRPEVAIIVALMPVVAMATVMVGIGGAAVVVAQDNLLIG